FLFAISSISFSKTKMTSDCSLRQCPIFGGQLNVHIPFCERLCWFCACHTQGTRTLTPVEHYVDMLEAEIARTVATLPDGVRMGRLHWGGGTPTILPPALIHRLAGALKAAIPPADSFEFSVEIDPTMVDRPKIEVLAAEGMTRGSIGIQDFASEVQKAIGRIQSFETTRACVADLRATGIASLNTDLVYGLPHQSGQRFADTVAKVVELAPDRLAIFGYAHVPWASKRQTLIDEAALPNDAERLRLADLAARLLDAAGYARIGIDHFAKPGDSLAVLAAGGGLRRNFQGYTDDGCATLIGLGASSISRFPQGYVQNAPATAAWQQRIAAGGLAGAKGYRMTDDDLLRARAIELVMCEMRLDLRRLGDEFGDLAERLRPECAGVLAAFGEAVVETADGFAIRPDCLPLTRLVASRLDAQLDAGGRFSRAS
ncbi:oxygen-independent coproporphyrinogen-3 oxidase, partial [Tranquillimonas rosea]